MDVAMIDILGQLPRSDGIQQALVSQDGPMGQALKCAKTYETAQGIQSTHPGLPADALNELYIEAISWANQACEHMHS